MSLYPNGPKGFADGELNANPFSETFRSKISLFLRTLVKKGIKDVPKRSWRVKTVNKPLFHSLQKVKCLKNIFTTKVNLFFALSI